MAMDVVKVVGRAHPEAKLLAESEQRLIDPILRGDAVALDLEQKTVGTENVPEGCHRLARAGIVAVGDPARHLTLQAARERDQTLRVLGQDFLIYARLVIHAL